MVLVRSIVPSAGDNVMVCGVAAENVVSEKTIMLVTGLSGFDAFELAHAIAERSVPTPNESTGVVTR